MIAVRILRDLRTANGRTFREKRLYELTDGDANALIRRGVAVIQKPKRKRRTPSVKTGPEHSTD